MKSFYFKVSSPIGWVLLFFLFAAFKPTTVQAQFPLYFANFSTNYGDWTPVGTNVWTVNGNIVQQTATSITDPCKLLLTNSTYSYSLPSTTPQGIMAKVRIDSWETNQDMSRGGISLMSNTTNGNGYCLLFHDANGTKQISLLNDKQSWGTGVNNTFTVGTWYWFKLQIVGKQLAGKVWQAGTSEPAAWTVTQALGGTNWNLTGSGYPGLVASSNGSTTRVSFDSVYVYYPRVIYVNGNVPASGIGYSWNTALKTLYEGITLCKTDSANQVRVAAGTYYNTSSSTGGGPYRLSIAGGSYSMTQADTLYGGFAGTEAYNFNVTQRNFTANPTILNGNNLNSVFSNSTITKSSVLDGFTITGGYSNLIDGGGGILNNGASPTLQNLIITGNTATQYGGGISNEYSSAPILINVVIANNVCNGGNGGGIDNWNSTPTLINVTIANNSATNGGGIADENTSTDNLDNCIVWGNSATNNTGNQLYIQDNKSKATLNNSCYSNSTNDVYKKGTFTATNCTTSDPLFINATLGDYRLQPTSPCVDKGNSNYFSGSPGYSKYTYDVRGYPYGRFINKTSGASGGTIDMGAYEYNPLMNFFYVTPNGTSNGISWSNPISMQNALNSAFATCQLLVAPGTYTPTATTVLKSNVKIYGGFAGTPGTEILSPTDLVNKLNARNLKANVSILTNTTAPIVSYSGTVTGALLDGFTITGATGGSSYVVNFPAGADTIQNCKIVNNSGVTGGLSLNNSNVGTNVLVADNSGVGINFAGTSAKAVNVTIANNTGAGINNSDASNAVTNSILWGNSQNISGTMPTITYSAGSSNYGSNAWSTGTGNIDLLHRSPNFKDGRNTNPAKRNYELLLISPCLGNGSAAANPLTIDANGKPRKYNSTIDMGAFEKWDGYIVNSPSGNNTSVFRSTTTFNSSTLNSIATSTGKDTVEVEAIPGANLSMGSNTIYVKWFELLQDTTSVQPAIVTKGTIIADSTLYVRRFSKSLSGKGVWSFFGAPFNTATMRSLDGAIDENSVRIEGYNESARALNGSGYAWAQGRLTPDSVMLAGKGYALSFNKKVPQNDIGQTVIFSSPSKTTFNETGSTTSQTIRLSATTAPLWYNTGWNFIANPLPQPAVISSMWNSSSTSYYGAVYVYKPITDSYNVIPASNVIAATANTNIAPGQGFFVQTDWNGATVTFQSTTASNPVLQAMAYVRPATGSDAASAPLTPATFRFNVAGGGDDCNTYVIFDPRAHAAVEPMEDNPVIGGMGSTPTLQLSTTGQGSSLPLAINRLPFAGASMTVPLQLYVPAPGTYTITMPQSDTIANVVLLQDSLGNVHNLSAGAGYVFNATQGGITQNFTLVFNGANTSIDVSKGISILQNHQNVTIISDSVLTTVSLYGAGGQLYFENRPNTTQQTLELPGKDQLYIIQMTTPQGVVTRKVISR